MKEKKTGKSATREEFGRKWRIRFNELVIFAIIGLNLKKVNYLYQLLGKINRRLSWGLGYGGNT